MTTKTQIQNPNQSGAITRKVIVWLVILDLLLIAAAWVWWGAVSRQRHERARAAWKAATLQRLAGLSITNENLSQELRMLKNGASRGGDRDWAGDNVLLMTNGEFLIYAFRHGFNSGFVDHLFLAHGSDGRWLYSTYHFCNSMAALMSEEPPGSIDEFAKRFSAHEFDGKSDECLKHTWPPKSREAQP